MPRGLSVEEFEERLHKRMNDASLNAGLTTREAPAHCAQIACEPAEFSRRTAYGLGDIVRFSEASSSGPAGVAASPACGSLMQSPE